MRGERICTDHVKWKEVKKDMMCLDNSATAQVDKDVAMATCEVMTETYGNPSSPYLLGRDVLGRLTAAGQQVAQVTGTPTRQIFFTSGGAEANNLTIRGSVLTARGEGRNKDRIITAAIEHSPILESCRSLEEDGYEVVSIRPRDGRIQADNMIHAVNQDILLMSIVAVSNETEERLPVEEIARGVKRENLDVLIHCDCVQRFGKTLSSLNQIKADMVTISSRKIHGPKGSRAIYVREGVSVRPLCFGGSQESKVRPGAENAPGIAAFGHASLRALRDVRENWEHIKELNLHLANCLQRMEDVVINSPSGAVPYVLNISVLPFAMEELFHEMRMRGIYLSGSSACEKRTRSHVIQAMGIEGLRAGSVVRIGLEEKNTRERIIVLIETLNELIKRGK